MAKKPIVSVLTAAVLLLTGCVVMPTAPSIVAMPGSQKSFDQFRADEDACRGYTQAAVGGAGQVAANNTAANAAAATAFGAAVGAIIGSATGQAGPGAAIGAGTGLLFGSAAGSNYAGYSSYQLQRQYDATYLQCMYSRGNRVPARFVYRGPPPGYPPDYAPPDYRAPPPYYYPPPRG